MSNNKNDDYINKYTNEVDPVLTDYGIYAPLVYAGFCVLMIIGYYFATSSGDKFQYIIFLVPVFAIRGLIISLLRLKARFRYIVYWRIGFYTCAASLVVSLTLMFLMFLRIIPIPAFS